MSDLTNPRKFTSATAAFQTNLVEEGDVILIRPTAAPLTAGGFADATRNGFYMVSQVMSETEVRLHTWFGVHTDGLPLNETGLTFEVHRFRTSALMPIDEDQFVLEGTGLGGTFHLNCRNDRNVNYGGGWLWEVSPWPDWIAGATHAWNNSPSRHTVATTAAIGGSSVDKCWMYGFADLTQFFIWFRGVEWNGNLVDVRCIYAGDIDPFHPASDPRPVVTNWGKDSLVDIWLSMNAQGVESIGADNLTQKNANHQNLCVNQNNAQELLEDSSYRRRSWHSGRWVRLPVLIGETETGFEELRGQFRPILRTRWLRV